MEITISPGLIYDLSNEHFSKTIVTTKDKQAHKGRFVKFRVREEMGESIYPAEKYCFLPESHFDEFAYELKRNEGLFETFPEYIIQMGLNEIDKIEIKPELII
jgi:hypothetical protein